MAQPKCPKCSTPMTMAVDSAVYITDNKMVLTTMGKIKDIVRIYCPNCGAYLSKEAVEKIVPDEALRRITKAAFE